MGRGIGKGELARRPCPGPGWGTGEWADFGTPVLLQTAAWGIFRTFLSFSIDKDAQRLPRAIAGQGEPLPSALGHITF